MIFPAIDIQNGESVRLYQGEFNQKTLAAANPLDQLKIIKSYGISYLHLVDLDGAKNGKPSNAELISKLCRVFQGFVEIGGGIRNEKTIENYLNNGVDRVILGSIALKNPSFTEKMIANYGNERIAIGIDGRDGLVATEGWLDQSTVPISKLIEMMSTAGARNFIVTDISRDGTMRGPNFDLYQTLRQKFPQTNIVVSGGIRDISDIKKLQQSGIEDMIVGKSLLKKTLRLDEIAEVNINAG